MARKMNINSVVGSYLDPLADKVLLQESPVFLFSFLREQFFLSVVILVRLLLLLLQVLIGCVALAMVHNDLLPSE